MRTLLFLVAVSLVPMAASAQDVAGLRKTFEAGRYQEIVDSSTGGDPGSQYLVAQSYQRLGSSDQAVEQYRQMAGLPVDSPWHWIGLSAQQLLADALDPALDSARRAVDRAGGLPEAHYQLGLVLAARQAWAEAAAAFDRVAELDPAYAYARYYAGLMYSRANRTDLMASRFEQFLKLAPEAPERPEVMQVMRTVRGR